MTNQIKNGKGTIINQESQFINKDVSFKASTETIKNVKKEFKYFLVGIFTLAIIFKIRNMGKVDLSGLIPLSFSIPIRLCSPSNQKCKYMKDNGGVASLPDKANI